MVRARVLTVVGARPQFIKAAPMSRALRARGHDELMLHTGQHYDDGMSRIFFEELGIPEPEVNLKVGPGTPTSQTAAMLVGLEPVLREARPDYVLVYGDTTSTLAGALAASRLGLPIVHAEAGMRSFVRTMPEEINRVVTDHLATLLWAPSRTAVDNLAREGIRDGVVEVGDVMVDALAMTRSRPSDVLERLGLSRGGYGLVTIHRAESTSRAALARILEALDALAEQPLVLPLHPRTRAVMREAGLSTRAHVRIVDPLGHADLVTLLEAARIAITDSGGVQREAYWLAVPCVTVRCETEWIETVATGWNTLVGTDRDAIVGAVRAARRPTDHPVLYGDGHAVERCLDHLEQALAERGAGAGA